MEVYFDDVTVTQTKSNLIQYNEYYPFGQQTAGSWTRENTLDNNFLANGGTELNKTSNLYDLDYRNYDQILGRMNGVDPLTTKYASLTPYNFSFNDPVTFTDPSGADPFDDWLEEFHELETWFNNTMPSTVMDPGGGGGYGSGAYYGSVMGGYGVMAGSYSVPRAGWGPSGEYGSTTIDINWSELKDGAYFFGFTRGYLTSFNYLSEREIRSLGSAYTKALVGGDKGPIVSDYTGGPRLWGNTEGTFFTTDPTIRVISVKLGPHHFAPSGLQNLIPVWGAGRQSIYWFNQNDASRALFYGALAVTDIAMVKAIITSLGKLATTAMASIGLRGASQVGYTFTKSTAAHLASRPYMNSPLLIEEIMASGKGIPDATFKGGMNWKVPGVLGQNLQSEMGASVTQGVWELGINPTTKEIYHFVFKSH